MAINKYIGVEVVKIKKVTNVVSTNIVRICTELNGKALAFFMGGGPSTLFESIQIEGPQNNVTNFGNLSIATSYGSGIANSLIGITSGGYVRDTPHPSETNAQQATRLTGATASMYSYGNLLTAKFYCVGFGNNIKGVISSGYGDDAGFTTGMEKISLSTTNSAAFFGDISFANCPSASAASATRGLLFGGFNAGYTSTSQISYRDFTTDGNMQYFGDLTGGARSWNAGCSNSTRLISAGGYTFNSSNISLSIINYKDFATLGNASNFGNQSQSSYAGCAAGSQNIALIYLSTPTAVVDRITYTTLSNSTNFSNLTVSRKAIIAYSNSHGGLN